MADNGTAAIGRIDTEQRTAVYQMAQYYEFSPFGKGKTVVAEKIQEEHAEVGKVAQAKEVEAPAPETKTEEQPKLPITQNNVYLQFRVDEESNNITVFVVDRATRRVLRSIPPEEVNKLHAGDLLKLMA